MLANGAVFYQRVSPKRPVGCRFEFLDIGEFGRTAELIARKKGPPRQVAPILNQSFDQSILSYVAAYEAAAKRIGLRLTGQDVDKWLDIQEVNVSVAITIRFGLETVG